MQIKAVTNDIRMSPRKVRLVADLIRNTKVDEALDILSGVEKRAKTVIDKTLKSAVANAVSNAKLKQEALMIKSIEIMQGPSMKRFKPSTRGRVHPYKKRTSHLRIVLEEGKGENK